MTPTPLLPAARRAAAAVLTKYDPAATTQPGFEKERDEMAAIIQKETQLLLLVNDCRAVADLPGPPGILSVRISQLRDTLWRITT